MLHSAARVGQLARQIWLWLRAVSGDDAYDRYLEQWREAHREAGRATHEEHSREAHQEHSRAEHDSAPLSRRDFFRARQDAQWNGISRCC